MQVTEERDRTPKRKTAIYLVGQIVLWWYFHLVFRMKVIGAENMPKDGPVLLCSNHLAKRDPVLLGLCQKRQVFYMAKEELFKNKFLGGLFRGLGAFPVKRGTGGGDALEDAYALLKQNGVVGVFIEGHRSKDGRLLKPKTGAALLAYETKAPVVPVCITAGDGKQPGMFKTTMIRFGKPISAEELDIKDDSSMQLRRASRLIMSRIADLREESCKALGLPSQLEPPKPKAPANVPADAVTEAAGESETPAAAQEASHES